MFKKRLIFYERAFGFKAKFTTPKKNYGEIALGETTLAFASIELANYNIKRGFIESNISEKPFGVELMFSTENVEELMEKAKNAGAIEEEKLMIKPWKKKVGYLRDNNGFLIEISSQFKN